MVNDISRIKLKIIQAQMLEEFEQVQFDPSNLNNLFSMVATMANAITEIIDVIDQQGESSD